MDYEQLLSKFQKRDRQAAELLLLNWKKNNVKVHISRQQKSVLHYSCYNGWDDLSLKLIEWFELDPSFEDQEGNTSLHMACMSGNKTIDIVKYLISIKKCNPLQINKVGHTALHCAIMTKNSEMVYYLVKNCGCDHLCKVLVPTIISHLLIKNWDEKVTKCLICDGGYQLVMEDGTTLQHELASQGLAKQVLFLVSDCNCDPNLQDTNGDTILHVLYKLVLFMDTCTEKHLVLEQLVLQYKCNPHIENANGETILHIVCSSLLECGYSVSRLYVLFFLLRECKVSPFGVNLNDEPTLLHICKIISENDDHKSKSWPSMFYYLIAVDCKCDPFQTKSDIYTAFEIAIKYSDTRVVGYIVEKCRHDWLSGIMSLRIMKLLYDHWDEEIAKCLICDAKLQLTMENGTTLLHAFASQVLVERISFLVDECKCDPLQMNGNGNTVLDCAIMAPNSSTLVSYLINTCGCDQLCKTVGKKIMKLLCDHWDVEVAKCLICDGGCPVTMENGTTLLHEFAKQGFISRVLFLITGCNCNPFLQTNGNGHTVLDISILTKNSTLASYLINTCECDQLCKSSGEKIMKLLYDHWDEEVAKCLICDGGCQLTMENGTTLLHEFTRQGFENRVKFLVAVCNCDLFQMNDDGRTVLDCAIVAGNSMQVSLLVNKCGFELHRTMGKKKIMKLLHDHWNENVAKFLICEEGCQLTMENGTTLLHEFANQGFEKRVMFLIAECKCDPFQSNDNGDTVLDIAIMAKNHITLVYYLVNECGCDQLHNIVDRLDLASIDESGNTILHIACNYFSGDTTLIEYILSTGKADPLCYNNDGLTPMTLLSKSSKRAGANQKVQQMIHRFGKVKVSHPIESYVNVVVLGNPGVGKSSLVKVIIDRPSSLLGYAFGRFRFVTEVDLCTAGIVPHILNDKDLGRIILHDLAGQAEYYSSHTAVLENLLQGSSAVFIVVISLADEMLQESFQFWLTAIENVSHNALHQCHLFVVASHADLVTDNSAFKIDILKKLLSSRLSSSDIIRQNKLIELDCRKLGGNQLDLLISSLSSTCKSVICNSLKKMTIYCHLLYDFFQISKKVILYQLESLLEIFLERNDLFLPSNVDSLVEIVHSLSSTGLIVFLRNKECLAKSWIVTDKSILLVELNGVLFAPEDFKEYVGIASNTGVIKLSDLCARFPNYDSELLVKFLQYMELCEVITEEFINLKVLSGNKVDDVNNEQYIFVPALIKDTQKPQIEEAFTFGWVLQCTNPHDFFFSRFLHLALLHLACNYSKTSGANKFERLCKVWTTGIYWKDTKGVWTLLEQVDNKKSLVLLTTCQDGAVNEMIKLIKNIIIYILSCKQQVMPKIDTCEFVIDNSYLQYPFKSFKELTLYNIELISECYINKDKFIIDKTGMKQVPISNLFPEVTAEQYYVSIFADRDPKVYIIC